MTNRKPHRLRVGVIGLGVIGSRAAANLRAAGHQVYVWNRTPRAEPNFLGSAQEVTNLCDTLQLFVSDDAALLDTVRAVAPVLAPRHLVLAHPTVSPEAAREAAGIVEERGARYLDAPFTGSRAAAGNGQLVYYVAGPEPARREALPILEATSKAVVVVGDAVGQASVVKIATNLLTASIVQSLAEALALTRATGVDPARFTEALEHNGSRSGTSDLKLPAMTKGDHATPHFALKHMLKDTRLALRLAGEHGLTLPGTATVTALLYGAERRGWGDMDFAALAKNYDAPAPKLLPPPSSPPPPLTAVIPEISSPTPTPTVSAEMPSAHGERQGTPADGGDQPAGDPNVVVAEKDEEPAANAVSTAEVLTDDDDEMAIEDAKKEVSADRQPITVGGGQGLPADAGAQEAANAAVKDSDTLVPVDTPVPPTISVARKPEPEPEPPRPPATRRTLLSWFQRGR